MRNGKCTTCDRGTKIASKMQQTKCNTSTDAALRSARWNKYSYKESGAIRLESGRTKCAKNIKVEEAIKMTENAR